jgi:hypothetical protein
MVRTLQRLADVVLYVALALGIAGALSGCTSSERSVRINQYMYAVYTRIPDVVERSVLYGDGRPYYAVTFTDGSILAISSHPADRSECVMNIRSDFPAFKRAMKLKDIVMYRTDPIVKDSLMDFDYKTSLMSLYVQNCGNGGNCLAAKHASIEMARLITSQFFRDCCVNGHECRD